MRFDEYTMTSLKAKSRIGLCATNTFILSEILHCIILLCWQQLLLCHATFLRKPFKCACHIPTPCSLRFKVPMFTIKFEVLFERIVSDPRVDILTTVTITPPPETKMCEKISNLYTKLKQCCKRCVARKLFRCFDSNSIKSQY